MDQSDLVAIYERYNQQLYRFCFSIVGNAEDAQDALQNAMLKAVRALPGERRKIQLKPWLYRIAHNESIDLLRRRRDEARIDPELAASAAGPDQTAASRERLRRLLADLSELPERQREALVMRELAGLEFAEIGQAFATSASVARQTVYEARLNLQRLEAGREMSCAEVTRQISDADGRVLRRRDIQAHLQSCAECREFRDAIDARKHDLAAIAPLPAIAAAGILQSVLAGAAGGGAGGASAAGAIGAGAGKVAATSAVVKSVATVAVVAAVGVGAADRGGLIDTGLAGSGKDNTPSESRRAEPRIAPIAPAAIERRPSNGRDAASRTAPGNSADSATGGNNRGRAGATGPDGSDPGRGDGKGPPDALPAAAQHGQETAAANKAKPKRGGAQSNAGKSGGSAEAGKGSGGTRTQGANSRGGSRGAANKADGATEHAPASSGSGGQANTEPKPSKSTSDTTVEAPTVAPSPNPGTEKSKDSP
ncbi:MAG TPA: sigma-70 family RNA polymerase sigma factor [Solirubrobacterales bacterium]|nr:sigma-70 family RNA polymerase sigma factor [Solirubrobacterales bacterium]